MLYVEEDIFLSSAERRQSPSTCPCTREESGPLLIMEKTDPIHATRGEYLPYIEMGQTLSLWRGESVFLVERGNGPCSI